MSQHVETPRRDEGFNLVEVLISIVIIGLLVGVLSGVFSVVLRTVPDVDARADAARTLSGVVTWLPQDVDSTPPTGFDTNPATASGCTLNQGVNVLRMEWTENVGSPVRYVANYRAVAMSSTAMRLERITCSGSGASPLGNSKSQPVSADLPPLPSGWAAGQLPVRVTITTVAGDVTRVKFEVQTLEGKIVQTDSAPKNPANTLEPTSTIAAPTSIATTTTSTTTTTIPSGTTTTVPGPTTTTSTTSTTTTTMPPCAILSASLSSLSMRNTDPNGNGRSNISGVGVLQAPVRLDVTSNGYCSGITASALTGAPNNELIRNAFGYGPNYTIDYPGYPQGSSELWNDGFRAIRIYGPNSSAILATVTLEVR